MANLVVFLSCFLISSSFGIIPSSSVSTSYVPIPQQLDARRNNYNFDQRGYYREQPPRSYIIFDGDINSLPSSRDRPQTSSTRSWHLEFNQRRPNQPIAPSTPVAYSSVFSNLIQVYDKPQNNREYETYGEPSGGIYTYHVKSRPIDVPKYDVIYPYQPEEQNYYNRDKLPDNFPKPFYPNNNFQFKDPSITSDVRKEYGYYHPQTISYPSQEDRASSRSNCNFIRLNEKGFPIANEMCGRSISDIILAPDYPTTGDLILEHRKRYRGTNQVRSLETNQVGSLNRKKRNAQNIQEGFNSYLPSSGCCGNGMGYGFRTPYRQDFGYNDNQFVSRPYERTRDVFGGYGYGGQGQYNYEDDVGEETSGNTNQGLTSYMENRGRGNRGRFKEDTYGDSEEDYDRFGSRSGNQDGNSNKSSNSNRDNGRKTNSSSRANRKNESSNRSSNNNQQSSDTSSQGNNKSVNNRRNFGGRSDSEDSFGNSGVSSRRNFRQDSEDDYGDSDGSSFYKRRNFGRDSEDNFGSSGGSSSYNRRNFGGDSESGSSGASVYNRRNFGGDSESGSGYNRQNFGRGSENNFGSTGGSNSRDGGNNYSYLRNDYSDRNNGANAYYGSSNRGLSGFGGGGGFRGSENMGGNQWMNSSPYNNNGFNPYGRFNK